MAGKRSRIPKYDTVEINGHTYYRTNITDSEGKQRTLYAAQYGRCAVTGKELWLDEIHCHHKQPLCRGGTDKYMNLVIVHRDIHRLIHATDPNTIVVYLNLFQLDKKALAKLNALRVLTGQPEI